MVARLRTEGEDIEKSSHSSIILVGVCLDVLTFNRLVSVANYIGLDPNRYQPS